MRVKPKKHRLRLFFHLYGHMINNILQILIVISTIGAVKITNDNLYGYIGVGLVYIVSLIKREK